jgi:hydrogenase maturation protease
MKEKRILVYGIGNPFRCDDAVGLKIADTLKPMVTRSGIVIKSGSIDGLSVLDEIKNFDTVFFIDSIQTRDGKPGDIYKIRIDPDRETSSTVTHGIDFITAVTMGKKLGYEMPARIEIFAVEIEDNTTFSEECTEKVTRSIPEVIRRIMEELER